MPRRGVDDAAAAFVAGQEFDDLAARLVLGGKGKAEIGPIEAVHDDARRRREELRDDVVARHTVGRGGERDGRHWPERLAHPHQTAIIGAEIVPPLRHAMRFVDGEQGHFRALEQTEKT